jgi:hypothetical protein
VTNLVSTLPRVRMAAFDTLAAMLLALDYLTSRPDVDAQRIFLVGGSMGAELGPPRKVLPLDLRRFPDTLEPEY